MPTPLPLRHLAAAAALLAAPPLAGRLPAQKLEKPCTVGQRVTDWTKVPGVVTAVDRATCTVRFANGETHERQFYMLSPLDAGAPEVRAMATPLARGRYTCYAGVPLQYTFADIVLVDATTYTDRKGARGAYAYDPRTHRVTFSSGAYRGLYAQRIAPDKIGLASTETTSFATVCGRQ